MPVVSCVALILAGGKARRMGGGDKPLLEIGGDTMLSRIIAVLREDVAAIAISANGDATASLPRVRLAGAAGWTIRGVKGRWPGCSALAWIGQARLERGRC